MYVRESESGDAAQRGARVCERQLRREDRTDPAEERTAVKADWLDAGDFDAQCRRMQEICLRYLSHEDRNVRDMAIILDGLLEKAKREPVKQ